MDERSRQLFLEELDDLMTKYDMDSVERVACLSIILVTACEEIEMDPVEAMESAVGESELRKG